MSRRRESEYDRPDAPGTSAAPSLTSPGNDNQPALSLVGLATIILRRRAVFVRVALLTTLAGLAAGFLRPATYTAESVFLPNTTRQAGSDLMSRLGLTLPSSGESLAFYQDLLFSRELLLAAAGTEYRFATDESPPDTIVGTLAEIYEIEAPDETRRLYAAASRLSRHIVVETNPAAGTVKLTVSAPWPELAVRINRRLLELVNQFNVERRQSQAAAERRFIEGRLAEVQRELRSAEEEAEQFFSQNRRYAESPQLRFEAARLERKIGFYQQVYSALATSYESARIEEVRNTPVITIVDGPEASVRSGGRGLILRGVLGAVLGLSLTFGYVFTVEGLERQRRRNPEEFEEFELLVRDTVGGLRRFRRVRDGRS